jgi:hypothetical protein
VDLNQKTKRTRFAFKKAFWVRFILFPRQTAVWRIKSF